MTGRFEGTVAFITNAARGPVRLAGRARRHHRPRGSVLMSSVPDQVSEREDITAAVAWVTSKEACQEAGIRPPLDLGTLTR